MSAIDILAQIGLSLVAIAIIVTVIFITWFRYQYRNIFNAIETVGGRLSNKKECLWCGNNQMFELEASPYFKYCRDGFGCKRTCHICDNSLLTELLPRCDICRNGYGCQLPCSKCGRTGTKKDFNRCQDIRKCHTRCFGNIDLCKPKYVASNEWKYLRREIWKYYYKK